MRTSANTFTLITALAPRAWHNAPLAAPGRAGAAAANKLGELGVLDAHHNNIRPAPY